jgi:hypothetical protein
MITHAAPPMAKFTRKPKEAKGIVDVEPLVVKMI